MKKSIMVLLMSLSFATMSLSAFSKDLKTYQIAEGHHHEKMVKSNATIKIEVDGLKLKFYVTDLNLLKKSVAKMKETYVCSMHNHVIEDHVGNCPSCGMKLTKKDKTKLSFDTKNGSSHLELTLTDAKTNEMIGDAKVKIKVISSDKKTQEKMLENNMGYYSNNFDLGKEKNEFIVLIKIGAKEKISKFYFTKD